MNLGLDVLNKFGERDSNDHSDMNKRRRYEPKPIDDSIISEITAPNGPPRFKTFGSFVW